MTTQSDKPEQPHADAVEDLRELFFGGTPFYVAPRESPRVDKDDHQHLRVIDTKPR